MKTVEVSQLNTDRPAHPFRPRSVRVVIASLGVFALFAFGLLASLLSFQHGTEDRSQASEFARLEIEQEKDGQHTPDADFNCADHYTGERKTECEALVALYNSTNGDGWTNKEKWKTSVDYCQWQGVGCGDSGRIISLYLPSNQLTGPIPEELGDLTNLRDLDLSSNQLTGSIPEELGDLTNLQVLGLSSNQLTGSIPEELGDLTNLQVLGLSSNQLTGSIPEELGDLTNLQQLLLSSNQLTGPIPGELGNLQSLMHYRLDNNRLSGELIISEQMKSSLASVIFNHQRDASGNNPSDERICVSDDTRARLQFIEGKYPAGDDVQPGPELPYPPACGAVPPTATPTVTATPTRTPTPTSGITRANTTDLGVEIVGSNPLNLRVGENTITFKVTNYGPIRYSGPVALRTYRNSDGRWLEEKPLISITQPIPIGGSVTATRKTFFREAGELDYRVVLKAEKELNPANNSATVHIRVSE